MLIDTFFPRMCGSFLNDDPFNRVRREMERSFEDPFFSRPLISTKDYDLSPACDVEDTESQYMLSMDLPGLEKDEIQIDISGNPLIISEERKEYKRQDRDSQRYVERHYGSFMRSFNLPSEVDANKVEANYDNGVLRIAVAKTEKAHRSHVKISSGTTGVFEKLLGVKKTEEKAAA